MRALFLALLLTANLSALAAPKPKPKVVPPGASGSSSASSNPLGSGTEPYTPTKCEWLAVELNSNFRVSNLREGYTLQIYCRSPSTMFLSYRYVTEADHDAALETDDSVRAAIGQVVRARGWKWVKVDGEMEKVDAPEPAPAVAAAAAIAAAKLAKQTAAAAKPKPKVKAPDDENGVEEPETLAPDEKPPGDSGKESMDAGEELPPVVDSIETKAEKPIVLEKEPAAGPSGNEE